MNKYCIYIHGKPVSLHDGRIIGIIHHPRYENDEDVRMTLRYEVVDDNFYKENKRNPIVEITYVGFTSLCIRGSLNDALCVYKRGKLQIKQTILTTTYRTRNKKFVHYMTMCGNRFYKAKDQVLQIECDAILPSWVIK